jgi:hypothetical protein
MKQINAASILLLLSFVFAPSVFSQNTQKKEVAKIIKAIEKTHRDIDWELFDTTSKVSIDKITPDLIKGSWKAYNGIIRFGGSISSMILKIPLTIEIKEGKYIRFMQSEFEEFTLTNNQIICKKDNDSGVINKINDDLLVITWKRGDNYSRYYYEK